MKICVWRTGHDIADRVAEAAWDGLSPSQRVNGHIPLLWSNGENTVSYRSATEVRPNWDRHSKAIRTHDIHIGYGILRGMDDVFRECDRQGKPWFCIDRGYFSPGHYNGYYRVSLRGTQQTSGWPEPDWDRWRSLEIPVAEPITHPGYTVVCPPTDYVCDYFGIDRDKWDLAHKPRQCLMREKGCNVPMDEDLTKASRVITFNSSVGWEALRRGIPVESDPVHSIVGGWQAKHGTDKREELFATMAGLQLTLDEMRGRRLLPLLQKLLDASTPTKA